MSSKLTGSGPCCAVIGCHNSWQKLKMWNESECEIHEGELHRYCTCLQPFSLHRFPRNEEMRQSWINALQRKNYNPKASGVVCGIHFVGGVKTKKYPVPTLYLGHSKQIDNVNEIIGDSMNSNIENSEFDAVAGENIKHDAVTNDDMCIDTYITTDVIMTDACIPSSFHIQDPLKVHTYSTRNNLGIDMCTQTDVIMKDAYTQYDNPLQLHTYCKRNNLRLDTCTQTDVIMKDAYTQFENPSKEHDHCQQNINETKLKEKAIKTTSTSVQTNHQHFMRWTPNEISDEDCKFYTGLSLSFFTKLVSAISKDVKIKHHRLPVFDQMFIVVVRLRLALLYEDLSRRSGVSVSFICKIMKFWIPIMASELKVLVHWLPRETIRASMPPLFRKFYPTTTCIIDCMEIYTEKPKLLYSRAVTYSKYKSHNTFKLLVAIAPNGLVMFVSDCYGGRASDKFITAKCGILNNLLPGDNVMVDRGFTIQDLLPHGVSMNIPSFTRGLQQLPEEDVTMSRRISSLRVHVERAIRKLRTYRILKGVLSLKVCEDIDNIVVIVAALCNLQPAIIKQSDDAKLSESSCNKKRKF